MNYKPTTAVDCSNRMMNRVDPCGDPGKYFSVVLLCFWESCCVYLQH